MTGRKRVITTLDVDNLTQCASQIREIVFGMGPGSACRVMGNDEFIVGEMFERPEPEGGGVLAAGDADDKSIIRL